MTRRQLLAFVVGTAFGAAFIPGPVRAATCTGANPCNACKNCSSCKRCAKDGKTCGTCKRAMDVSHFELRTT